MGNSLAEVTMSMPNEMLLEILPVVEADDIVVEH